MQLKSHSEKEIRLLKKIKDLEMDLDVALEKESQLVENAQAIEEALAARAAETEAHLRADFEQQSAQFQETLENEKELVSSLSDELNAAKMQLASAKNETCSSQNATRVASACPNDLNISEEIERLTSEKRQIIAFFIQVFTKNKFFTKLFQFIAVYVFWKLGGKIFKKTADPGHSELASELSRVRFFITIYNYFYIFSISKSLRRHLSITEGSKAR
jgi:hypothetical protein